MNYDLNVIVKIVKFNDDRWFKVDLRVSEEFLDRIK